MPDERMAANLLSVGLGESDAGVGAPPVEASARRLDDAPFHLVLRRDRGQLLRREVAITLFVQVTGVERGAEVAPGRCRGRAKRRFAGLGRDVEAQGGE